MYGWGLGRNIKYYILIIKFHFALFSSVCVADMSRNVEIFNIKLYVGHLLKGVRKVCRKQFGKRKMFNFWCACVTRYFGKVFNLFTTWHLQWFRLLCVFFFRRQQYSHFQHSLYNVTAEFRNELLTFKTFITFFCFFLVFLYFIYIFSICFSATRTNLRAEL